MTHITEEIAALSEWTIKELRAKWHDVYGSPPPPKMSRDLLTRALSHHEVIHVWDKTKKR